MIPGQKNVQAIPLVDRDKIVLPPLHIELGIVRNFIKAMNKTGAGVSFLREKFPRLSEAKLKEGVVVGPDIRKLMLDSGFDAVLNEVELKTWKSVKNVINNYLGNRKSENYETLNKQIRYVALIFRQTEKLVHSSKIDHYPYPRILSSHGLHIVFEIAEKYILGTNPMADCEEDKSRDRERNRRLDRTDCLNNQIRERSQERNDRYKRVTDKRIYVSNIPYDYRWQDLKDLFRTEVGRVAHVELFTDESDKPRGCGIVEFEDADSVRVAVEKMHRFDIKGRKLVVKEVGENCED
ncbi:hypothetical protein QAD02_012640 [Eretmocerus hayati]|uniref:Uncharacterized protein n=1 Tax=Eretmocerus hayati TaxID=131215 RepID=A0ACC2P073_9HYME|nr:hypothetical protein QAD02_012640 [Eretmocerus hayati]